MATIKDLLSNMISKIHTKMDKLEITESDEGKILSIENGQIVFIEQEDDLATEEYVNNAIASKADKTSLGILAAKNTVAKSDLESSIQISLDKADSALQSYTETDPTVPAWAKNSTKPTYTATEITAGTFSGEVVAGTQTPDRTLLRNTKLVSTETTPSVNGEIYWQYE